MITDGVPVLAIKRLNDFKNDDLDISGTSSKCIARAVAHVNSKI